MPTPEELERMSRELYADGHSPNYQKQLDAFHDQAANLSGQISGLSRTGLADAARTSISDPRSDSAMEVGVLIPLVGCLRSIHQAATDKAADVMFDPTWNLDYSFEFTLTVKQLREIDAFLQRAETGRAKP